MPHLLAALSGHGHGHLVQIAPLLQQLHDHIPGLTLTIQSRLPPDLIAAKVARPCRTVAWLDDPGLVMRDPMRVDAAASFAAYQALHARWDEAVAAQGALTERLAPDLVLADVPFLPLAAARAAGVANIALCSLNWADLFHTYCGDRPGAAAIEARIRACYQEADGFLRPAPSMPMADLPNTQPIGALARQGQHRWGELRARLGVAPDTRVVMVSLGGTPGTLPVSSWRGGDDLLWLLPDDWPASTPRCRHIGELDWPFEDVLRACDAFLTKPGYGAFSYAVCNGVPLVYVHRPDWPEEPAMLAWASRHGVAVEVSEAALRGDGPGEALTAVWSRPRPHAWVPTGAADAARWLQPFLRSPSGSAKGPAPGPLPGQAPA